MEVIRKVNQFELNEGSLQARGLYNLTNNILMEHTEDEGVSDWFDEEVKDAIINLSEGEFVEYAKEVCGDELKSTQLKSTCYADVVKHVKYGYLSQSVETPLKTFRGGMSLEAIMQWYQSK